MGADSWLLGSRCDRVVTCASEVAKEGTVKDGSGYSEPEEGQVWGCGGRGWAVSMGQGRGRCCPTWEHSTLEPRERATEISMGDIGAWMITSPTGA